MNPSLYSFFDDLESEIDVDRLVQEKREEDLYLEFKQKADRSNGDLSDKERRAFSKALSGFANADGGILLFGIETKKSQDAPDRAHALKPIMNAERFRVRLLDSIINATQPAVDGVRIEMITCTSGEGYVKCLVPASDLVPHRAMLADREYWRRTSNGFQRMEHYELEDVFGRRQRPVLRVRVELRPRFPGAAQLDEVVNFQLLNAGRGLARHVGFICEFGECKVAGTEGVSGLQNISHLNSHRPVVCFQNNSVFVVHPHGLWVDVGDAIIRRNNPETPLQINVRWYAENMSMKSQEVSIEPNTSMLLS